MINRVLDAIDALDLTKLQIVLAIIGALLAVYVMSANSAKNEDAKDPLWLQWLRRWSYALIALAMLWSTQYWQPWPPQILLMVGVMVMLGSRAATIHLRIKRERQQISTGPR